MNLSWISLPFTSSKQKQKQILQGLLKLKGTQKTSTMNIKDLVIKI